MWKYGRRLQTPENARLLHPAGRVQESEQALLPSLASAGRLPAAPAMPPPPSNKIPPLTWGLSRVFLRACLLQGQVMELEGNS